MNPNNSFYIYLFAIALLLVGCDFNSLKDPIILTDVEDEFFLDLWEDITPQGRTFQFRIRTIDNLPCSNSNILFDLRQEGINIDISLQEISQPSDCIPSNQPIKTAIDLGALPNQYFALKIDLREAIVNRAHFTVSENAFLLDMQSEYGIKPLHTQLNRIPSRMHWGYISYPSSLEAEVNALIQDISELSKPYLPSDGYYGYFTVANNTLAITAQPENQPLQSLIFDLEDPNQQDQLHHLINAFRNSFANDGVNILFRDGKGNQY